MARALIWMRCPSAPR